ncbi:receptor-like protein kinase FERONIA [Hibiscus syriacus]|uniref:receptor-like protein kinase FERONIA n=1 Tax=Hibiscus syriacus TaxID=106335 RepID=UPI001920B4DE|nr:receptor-like protein kinase FERONIA [Hibiscus syriacus]
MDKGSATVIDNERCLTRDVKRQSVQTGGDSGTELESLGVATKTGALWLWHPPRTAGGLAMASPNRFLVRTIVEWRGADENYDPISWKQRLEICIGLLRALHYLHTGAKFVLIHRDVSSKNILLDNQWTSKLCNFGFCKRGPLSLLRGIVSIEVESDITYTFACLDPKVVITSRVSDKSDVCSFGVVLFEVMCRRRVFDAELEMDRRILYHWACKCIENGQIYSIIDPYLKGKIAQPCLKKFLEIAYGCVQFEVNKRPTMGEVEATLNGEYKSAR